MNPISMVAWRDPKKEPPPIAYADRSATLLFVTWLPGRPDVAPVTRRGSYHAPRGDDDTGFEDDAGWPAEYVLAWAPLPVYDAEGATADDLGKMNERIQELEAHRAELRKELGHLVFLMEPVEYSTGLNIPGLATLNGARNALAATLDDKEALHPWLYDEM